RIINTGAHSVQPNGGGRVACMATAAHSSIRRRPVGESVARFISWLNAVSGASKYLTTSRGTASAATRQAYLGGHQAGIVGRNLGGQVSYITCKYLTTSRVQPRRAPGRHSGQEPGRTVSYHIAGHSLGGHQAGIVGRNLGGQVSYITYHIAGHSLGGHQAGIVGRNLGGQVSYITCEYLTSSWAQPRRPPGRHSGQEPGRAGLLHHVQSDGIYTEVIHTNAGITGFLTPLGDVDFYPNGGSGGFSGTRCSTYIAAINGDCALAGGLNMGGITAKTGYERIALQFHKQYRRITIT
ncbi:Pancreatic lipase 2, partial [Operophtera brumata]